MTQPEERDDPRRRREPLQPRSRATWSRILEAAAGLFSERGYDQTTTHQIAARASISVGALYRYFADKQAILDALYRREVTDLRKRLLDEFDLASVVGQDIPKLVRKTVALALQIYAERPALRRVLGEQSRKIPELGELRRTQEQQIYQAVQQILTAAPRVRLPDVQVGAYLIALFIETLIDDYVLYRRGSVAFDDERLLDAAVDFIVRYALGQVE